MRPRLRLDSRTFVRKVQWLVNSRGRLAGGAWPGAPGRFFKGQTTPQGEMQERPGNSQ